MNLCKVMAHTDCALCFATIGIRCRGPGTRDSLHEKRLDAFVRVVLPRLVAASARAS